MYTHCCTFLNNSKFKKPKHSSSSVLTTVFFISQILNSINVYKKLLPSLVKPKWPLVLLKFMLFALHKKPAIKIVFQKFYENLTICENVFFQ